MAATETERWPSIVLDGWQDTRDTLHLYTQIVGKVRLANASLTMATLGVSLPSCRVKSRPRRIGAPNVANNPSDTTRTRS